MESTGQKMAQKSQVDQWEKHSLSNQQRIYVQEEVSAKGSVVTEASEIWSNSS